ncbi:unnamed protein product [Pleuronectes platessa]|uniref:Uncharacterized protein n=1 Tax=Pleuronectes platessa TaxID=8262 RepID=A0A9N7U9C5_PLEPL|nr:unnamed protein product [Pleuronectes platessa]
MRLRQQIQLGTPGEPAQVQHVGSLPDYDSVTGSPLSPWVIGQETVGTQIGFAHRCSACGACRLALIQCCQLLILHTTGEDVIGSLTYMKLQRVTHTANKNQIFEAILLLQPFMEPIVKADICYSVLTVQTHGNGFAALEHPLRAPRRAFRATLIFLTIHRHVFEPMDSH